MGFGVLLIVCAVAFEEAFCSSIVVKPSLGNALTGWTPKKPSLVDGIDVYWASYLAHKE
jgi:hypothetical protein